MKTLRSITTLVTFAFGATVTAYHIAVGAPVPAAIAATVTIVATAGTVLALRATMAIGAGACAVALAVLGSGIEATVAGMFALGVMLTALDRPGVRTQHSLG